MKKPRIGIVGLCSKIESGAERFESLMTDATASLKAAGMDVFPVEAAVYTPLEAVQACEQMKADEVDAVAMMDVTWVCDSLKYVFVHEMNCPMILWAVPFTETFSIGCVQNFGSAMKTAHIHYEYVYGLPTEPAVVAKIKNAAIAAQIVKKLSSLRIAVLGPRQTWRVAGPQDMSLEEWEFSRTLGPTILHMDMEVIIDAANAVSDIAAAETLETLRDRTGKTLCSDACMLWMAKVYMATKRFAEAHGIDVIAAECYPLYSGMLNQTSSWLEDEGYIIDTEGDIANAVVKYMMNMAGQGGCCALGEAGSFSDEEDVICAAHEGSTPVSLAASLDEVQVSPSGDTASFVGFPLKPMEHCTVCDMQGSAGRYQLMIASGSVLPATHEEWVNGGEKLLIKLRVDGVKPSKVIDQMLQAGLHHHLVVKEGDQTQVLRMACRYLGMDVVTLG